MAIDFVVNSADSTSESMAVPKKRRSKAKGRTRIANWKRKSLKVARKALEAGIKSIAEAEKKLEEQEKLKREQEVEKKVGIDVVDIKIENEDLEKTDLGENLDKS